MTTADGTRGFGRALVLVTLFGCGRDAIEGRPLERPPSALSTSASTSSHPLAAASDAGSKAPSPGPQLPHTAKLDVDLDGARVPLALAFSPTGHLLFATRQGLWDWDPSGAEKTKKLASTPESLFGAQVRMVAAEFPDHLSILPPKSTTAEDWQVRATFSGDGVFAAFYAENASFAQANKYTRQSVVVSVHRTDTGERVGTWTKTLKVESSPEYAFVPRLSPSGRFLVVEKVFQLEVFEAATGRSVFRRSGGGVNDVSTFLNETTLLRPHSGSLEVLDLAAGRLRRSHRSVKDHAVSPNRESVALLEKGAVRVWNVASDTVTLGCREPRICEFCSVQWADPTHTRAFDATEGKTEVVCGVDGTAAPSIVAHVQPPLFQGEGFTVVKDVATGPNHPPRVIVNVPKVGKAIPLVGASLELAASHGRLLVQGDNLRLIDATGELHELTKRH